MNRVFQNIEVPCYLDHLGPDAVFANIYNEQDELIQQLHSSPSSIGINYLIWKLDEAASHLPGGWIHDESRGISVLSGTYKVVLS